MTNQEKKEHAQALSQMVHSNGGKVLLAHIEDEIKDGWDKFIALPVAQKTGKEAFNHQARYEVLKDLKDWIYSEIKLGE